MSELHPPAIVRLTEQIPVKEGIVMLVRRTVASSVVVAVALVATAVGAVAFNPQPEPPHDWVISTTDEQAVSVNVANSVNRRACDVETRFVDEMGETLARERATIRVGASRSFEFMPMGSTDPRDVPGTPAMRDVTHVRAVVMALTPSCELGTTVEIFDEATGETTAILAG